MLLTSLRSGRRDPGFALITALVMLLVITVLALAGARMALDTKRMSRNQRDSDIAFQAAEAALRDAEYDIRNNTAINSRVAQFQPESAEGFPAVAGTCNSGTPGPTSGRGLCLPSADNDNPVWKTVSWNVSATTPQTVAYGDFTGRTFPTGSGVLPPVKPRYIIELLPDTSNGMAPPAGGTTGPYLYRITAVGWGPNSSAPVMLQTTYRKLPKADNKPSM